MSQNATDNAAQLLCKQASSVPVIWHCTEATQEMRVSVSTDLVDAQQLAALGGASVAARPHRFHGPHTRLTFQNSGPVKSNIPARFFRYAVGIWNCPRVTVGAWV